MRKLLERLGLGLMQVGNLSVWDILASAGAEYWPQPSGRHRIGRGKVWVGVMLQRLDRERVQAWVQTA
jgi:uncharacterized RDD family membrane protein YckC